MAGHFLLVKRLYVATLLLVFGLSSVALAQASEPKVNAASCRTFVQGFYDWYVAHGTNLQTALKLKRTAFSPVLADALAADVAANAKRPDEVAGLDFDPLVNSQDPFPRYQVGKTTVAADHCSAEVFGFDAGKKSPKPDVTAELHTQAGKWQFTNFHYGLENGPADENLLGILRRLRQDRERSK